MCAFLQRRRVEDLLDDEHRDLKDAPYHDVVVRLLDGYHTKLSDYEKAVSKATEKEG